MALARGRRRFAPKATPNALVAEVPGSESGRMVGYSYRAQIDPAAPATS
jgi:hypothetical protein